MGYSCTAKAGYTLDAIVKLLQLRGGDSSTSNCFNYRGEQYFEERGRENADGAVTGTVFRIYTDAEGVDRCKRIGGYRIEPEGQVTRFPTTDERIRLDAYNDGMKKYKENHDPHGVLA